MAELQLAGFLADLVHREIDDPAELIAVLIHMAFAAAPSILSQHTCGLLGLQLLACAEEPTKSPASREDSLYFFRGLRL